MLNFIPAVLIDRKLYWKCTFGNISKFDFFFFFFYFHRMMELVDGVKRPWSAKVNYECSACELCKLLAAEKFNIRLDVNHTLRCPIKTFVYP